MMRQAGRYMAMLMASMSDIETTKRGSMWELDQNLDQPKDKDVSQLKDMYR
jgi:KUP system potassium uptake protein